MGESSDSCLKSSEKGSCRSIAKTCCKGCGIFWAIFWGYLIVMFTPQQHRIGAWLAHPILEIKGSLFLFQMVFSHLTGFDNRPWVREFMAKQAIALNKEGALPEPVESVQMPELPGDCSYEDVLKVSRGLGYPIVIRGAVNDPHWTPERFTQNDDLANAEYHFQCDANVTTNVQENHWNGWGCHTKESMREAVGNVSSGLYMRQNDHLMADFPILKEELGIQKFEDAMYAEGPWTPRIFIGVPPTNGNKNIPTHGSTLHSGPAVNWFIQAAGYKTWTVLAPRFTPRLLPLFDRRPGVASLYSRLGYGAEPHAPETKTLEYFDRWETTLAPGDVLVCPSWWWHEIVNFPPGELNIGVSLRGGVGIMRALWPWNEGWAHTVGNILDLNKLRQRWGKIGTFENSIFSRPEKGADKNVEAQAQMEAKMAKREL